MEEEDGAEEVDVAITVVEDEGAVVVKDGEMEAAAKEVDRNDGVVEVGGREMMNETLRQHNKKNVSLLLLCTIYFFLLSFLEHRVQCSSWSAHRSSAQ